MRFGCALVLVLIAGRADRPVGPTPALSCEEECGAHCTSGLEGCDLPGLADAARQRCEEAVRASLDVCLRLCED